MICHRHKKRRSKVHFAPTWSECHLRVSQNYEYINVIRGYSGVGNQYFIFISTLAENLILMSFSIRFLYAHEKQVEIMRLEHSYTPLCHAR